MSRVRWTIRALRRLDQIGAFIAKDNPNAAARVVARIVSAADNLAEQPAMGRIGRIRGTRELVLTDIPYLVPYRVVGREIEIITVMHASQKWRGSYKQPPSRSALASRLETPAGIVYISLKFLVGMTKSGSTRSRSFLLPAARYQKTTGTA